MTMLTMLHQTTGQSPGGLGQRATIYLRWALGVLFLTLVAVLFVPATAVGEWSETRTGSELVHINI